MIFKREKKSAADRFLDRLQQIFEQEGKTEYLGEQVSIAEHMLQAAYVAKRSDAAPTLIAACLLHDIGYFARVRNVVTDRHRTHDLAGAEFLEDHFPPEVTEPIRLHVAAKRYLVAVDPAYMEKLSEASIHTLGLQGGPMTPQEITEFESNPHHRDALQIREWDDSGKDKDSRRILRFEQFREMLAGLIKM